mmetsp:Transcript_19272/g.39833  ORF Transcript_19272/g.39833 Transcript_19272/m.39833 type:complete len:273 (-) Transcript_19272:1623-2441(-)
MLPQPILTPNASVSAARAGTVVQGNEEFFWFRACRAELVGVSAFVHKGLERLNHGRHFVLFKCLIEGEKLQDLEVRALIFERFCYFRVDNNLVRTSIAPLWLQLKVRSGLGLMELDFIGFRMVHHLLNIKHASLVILEGGAHKEPVRDPREPLRREGIIDVFRLRVVISLVPSPPSVAFQVAKEPVANSIASEYPSGASVRVAEVTDCTADGEPARGPVGTRSSNFVLVSRSFQRVRRPEGDAPAFRTIGGVWRALGDGHRSPVNVAPTLMS